MSPPVLTLGQNRPPAIAEPGAAITYTLAYGDTLANAANVTLTDTLPAGVTDLRQRRRRRQL